MEFMVRDSSYLIALMVVVGLSEKLQWVCIQYGNGLQNDVHLKIYKMLLDFYISRIENETKN